MGAIEKNQETLKRFKKSIDDFNEALEKIESETGFYVNLEIDIFSTAGSLRKKSIIRAKEVCIF